MNHNCPEGWVLHNPETGAKECVTCGETEVSETEGGNNG